MSLWYEDPVVASSRLSKWTGPCPSGWASVYGWQVGPAGTIPGALNRLFSECLGENLVAFKILAIPRGAIAPAPPRAMTMSWAEPAYAVRPHHACSERHGPAMRRCRAADRRACLPVSRPGRCRNMAGDREVAPIGHRLHVGLRGRPRVPLDLHRLRWLRAVSFGPARTLSPDRGQSPSGARDIAGF
jgi:hypothetical protein